MAVVCYNGRFLQEVVPTEVITNYQKIWRDFLMENTIFSSVINID